MRVGVEVEIDACDADDVWFLNVDETDLKQVNEKCFASEKDSAAEWMEADP